MFDGAYLSSCDDGHLVNSACFLGSSCDAFLVLLRRLSVSFCRCFIRKFRHSFRVALCRLLNRFAFFLPLWMYFMSGRIGERAVHVRAHAFEVLLPGSYKGVVKLGTTNADSLSFLRN